MAELSEEEQKVLERLRRDAARREQIPESERHMITNPDKYAIPIGFDDEGKPFENRPSRKSRDADCD